MTKVYFLGAGPGDPELITVKALRIIEKADVIIYADSLVNPEVCATARAGVEIYGSASLTLEEIVDIMVSSVQQGKTVARLHSGDPAIYGAIQEQMVALDKQGIDYEVIPGVSSLFAAAAMLRTELTLPDISQTVIITRMEGRTPVPGTQKLRELAAHRAALAIFLSTSLLEAVSAELLAAGYSPEDPVALVHRASWQDGQAFKLPLKDLASRAREMGINKQALVLAGDFLKGGRGRSKLYDGDFKRG
ncbi:MAG: precorrin-4 C(11)-methyltransferase [Chloroflexi bacterium]|nr:precorrin-4 C(11)-methyltransferase [Chloroflexota bacterium]